MMGLDPCFSKSCASRSEPTACWRSRRLRLLRDPVARDRPLHEGDLRRHRQPGRRLHHHPAAPSLEGVGTQLLKNLSQFGIVCALLLAMGSVVWEKERGTAGMIMTKPASRQPSWRPSLWPSRSTWAWALSSAAAWPTCTPACSTLQLRPRRLPGHGRPAVVDDGGLRRDHDAGSTLTRSAIAAAGIAMVALIAFGIVGSLPVVGPYMPSALGDPAFKLMMGRDTGDILGPLIFNVALVPALFGVTWLVFRRQEL